MKISPPDLAKVRAAATRRTVTIKEAVQQHRSEIAALSGYDVVTKDFFFHL